MRQAFGREEVDVPGGPLGLKEPVQLRDPDRNLRYELRSIVCLSQPELMPVGVREVEGASGPAMVLRRIRQVLHQDDRCGGIDVRQQCTDVRCINCFVTGDRLERELNNRSDGSERPESDDQQNGHGQDHTVVSQ